MIIKAKWLRWIFVTILVVGGTALVVYPYAASWLNSLTQTSVIDGYLSSVANTDTQDIAQKLQQAEEYNDMLLQSSSLHDPFSVQAYEVALDDYSTILDSGGGLMGYLEIPSIDVHLPIYHGTSPYALRRGVGHLESTSFPIGGEGTHAVMSAHSGLTSAVMFDDLEDLKLGDLFSVTILDRTIWYSVASREVVLPNDISSLTIRPGEDLCTLVTCTPYGINTHRLLVHGERCEPPIDAITDTSDKTTNSSEDIVQYWTDSGNTSSLFIVIAIFIVIGLIFIILLVLPKRKDDSCD